MKNNSLRNAWVEINLENLKHNLNSIKEKVGDKSKITCVVKADAYGHGAVEVVKVLKSCDINSFAVSTVEEALELRDAGYDDEITILGAVPDHTLSLLLAHHLKPVISDFETALKLSKEALKKGTTLKAFIALDTGMGRLGFLSEDSDTINKIIEISKLSGLELCGIFSHFATADERDVSYAKLQLEHYDKTLAALEEKGLSFNENTLANSAAVMAFPNSYYDEVRPGIILYGCYPSREVDQSLLDIKPVMSVKAKIIHLKKVPAGFSCGYGRMFVAKRESLIATLPLGYADGFPRPYSAVGRVIVDGKYAPLAGNICMDQCMIDVTDIPNVKKGDTAIILGKDGDLSISADEIGKLTGTINYEILCSFGLRLPKVYK